MSSLHLISIQLLCSLRTSPKYTLATGQSHLNLRLAGKPVVSMYFSLLLQFQAWATSTFDFGGYCPELL